MLPAIDILQDTWLFTLAWLAVVLTFPRRRSLAGKSRGELAVRSMGAFAVTAIAYVFTGWIALFPSQGHMSGPVSLMALATTAWAVPVVAALRVYIRASRTG